MHQPNFYAALLLLNVLLLLTFFTANSIQQSCTTNSFDKCNSITCGTNSYLSINSTTDFCPCKETDIGAEFTSCDASSNTKSMFFFWRPPAVCIGGLSLPQPLRSLPCDYSCAQGQFFNMTSRSCADCTPGHFSSGRGFISLSRFDRIIPQMKNYCTTSSYFGSDQGLCTSAWSFQGTHVESTNKGQDNTNAVLEYVVEIGAEGGSVSFRYQVEGEARFDYLLFQVDTDEKLKAWAQIGTWGRSGSIALAPGYHTLRWIYKKDFSMSVGMDKALVSDILILGTTDLPMRCIQCSEGYYSDGKQPCMPCPIGFFSEKAGSAECRACPSGYSSFEGSTWCFPITNKCTSKDYYQVVMSPCDPENNTQAVEYRWVEPLLCNTSAADSAPLPEPQLIACNSSTVQCHPGQQYNPDTQHCESCPKGTFGTGLAGSSCEACASGSTSQRRWTYFDRFDYQDFAQSPFRTECSGQCQSGGWRMIGNQVDSGLGNGISRSSLMFNIDLSSTQLALEYKLACKHGDANLRVYVDDQLVQRLECPLAPSDDCTQDIDAKPWSTLLLTVPELDVNDTQQVTTRAVRLMYDSVSWIGSDAYNCDRAVVKLISVASPTLGGAADCTQCIAGTHSVNGTICVDCQAGTISTAGQESCQSCPDGTFSYAHGTQCFECGAGTVATQPPSDTCAWQYGQCQFNAHLYGIDRTFAWRAVQAQVKDNSFTLAGDANGAYFFNLCRDQSSASICPKDSLFCRKDTTTGTVQDFGSVVSLGKISEDDRSGMSMDLVALRSGKTCKNGTDYIRTRIEFECKDSRSQDGNVVGRISRISADDDCAYKVQFKMVEVCPLCVERDWFLSTGECRATDNQRDLRWLRYPTLAHRCFGGLDKSNNITVQKCDASAVQLEAPLWLIAAIGVPAALLVLAVPILVIAVIVFYKRYKDVALRYSELQDDRKMENDAL